MMRASSHDDTIIADQSAPRRVKTTVSRGDEVGRYVVVDRIGAGGMGVVYGAYDPELDRKVAIKQLHFETRDGDIEASRQQLLREAKALAKLAHPNVVTIYDVIDVHERLWLAMELVDGQTLKRWLRAQPRPWKDVVGVLVRAGRGLAAAHAAGLVHRDVKPDNVMVASEGRVLVMDFGLARQVGDGGSEVSSGGASASSSPSGEHTQGGVLAGTPAYMAPERLLGLVADAKADQFAFCVMAWEALFGEHPFGGKSHASLVLAITDGTPREPSSSTGVPRWLRDAIQRGLASEPDARWPTMTMLLREMSRGHARARRRRIIALGLAVSGATAGVFGWQHLEHNRSVAACAREGDTIAASWPGDGGDHQERLRDAFVATKVPGAEASLASVTQWLDRWADEWRTSATDGCIARTIEDVEATRVHERRAACLEERRDAFEILIGTLEGADTEVVHRAVGAAAGLVSPRTCDDDDRLRARPVPPDDADRDAIRSIRRAIERVRTHRYAGKVANGADEARAVLADAQALGWAPLVATARYELGAMLQDAGDARAAEPVLFDAWVEALAAGDDRVAESAAVMLTHVVGSTLARDAEGLAWGRQAEAILVRAGADDGRAAATLATALGSVHLAHGRAAEARPRFAHVVEIREALLGADHPDLATALGNLAIAESALGDYAAAQETNERALEIHERALGPDHPSIATALDNLAIVLHDRGEDVEAELLHRRGLEIRERVFGPEHPALAHSLTNLGVLLAERGRYDEALEMQGRALAIWESTRGPEHPDVAGALGNLALIHKSLGDLEQAQRLLERGLAIETAAFGDAHPQLAPTLHNLALLHLDRKSYADAERLFTRALAIAESAGGPDNPDLAHPLIGLADVALAQGRSADALPVARRALALRERAGASPGALAGARFTVARALWAADRAAARELAELAAEDHRAAGESAEAVDAWLAAHPIG